MNGRAGLRMGFLPRPLACADKRRDPEVGRVGAERGGFYKGTAPPLTVGSRTPAFRLQSAWGGSMRGARAMPP